MVSRGLFLALVWGSSVLPTYICAYIFTDFLRVDPEAQRCVPSPGVTSSRNQLLKWLNPECHSARTPLHWVSPSRVPPPKSLTRAAETPAAGAGHPFPAAASCIASICTVTLSWGLWARHTPSPSMKMHLESNRLPIRLHEREIRSRSLAVLHFFPLISAIAEAHG